MVEAGEHVERGVELSGRAPPGRGDHDVTAGDLVVTDPVQVERDPVACPDLVDVRPQGLDRTDPGAVGAGLDRNRVVVVEPSARERAGHHRSTALGGEHAVDPQPRSMAIGRLGGVSAINSSSARRSSSSPLPLSESTATIGAPSRNVSADVVGDLEHGDLEPLVVDQIALGHGDHAVPQAEQLEDPEVLLRLWLPALGRRHHEQAGVDPTDAGQHVAQEPHVARHVDEADRRPRRQHRVGEAEVDRQAAALLLLEPVGVGARQGQHQRRLAVVDVPGGGDDPHVAGGRQPRADRAAMTSPSSAGSTERRSSTVCPSRVRAITGGSLARNAASTSPVDGDPRPTAS